LLTGTVRDIKQTSENLEIEIELNYPPQIMRSFSIPLQEANNEMKIKQTLENSVNKIVRIEVNNNQESAICSIEILTEDHLWYKFKELKSGKLEDVTYFSQLILKQKEIIEEYIRTFTELLFNLGKNLSKTTLTALRSLLNSKIYNAEVEFPYTLLISDNEISTYLDSMLEFSRSFIYGSNIVQDPDDLLELIGNFFPPYKMKVNNS